MLFLNAGVATGQSPNGGPDATQPKPVASFEATHCCRIPAAPCVKMWLVFVDQGPNQGRFRSRDGIVPRVESILDEEDRKVACRLTVEGPVATR